MGAPNTLPADFDKFDAPHAGPPAVAAPGTLPADFDKFDDARSAVPQVKSPRVTLRDNIRAGLREGGSRLIDSSLAAAKAISDPLDRAAAWGGRQGAGIAEQALHVEPFSTSPGMESMGEATGEQAPPAVVGPVRAVGSVAGSTLADPRNLPFMLEGGGAVRPVLQKAIKAGFTALMAKGATEAAGEYGKVMDDPDVPDEQKYEMATQAVLQAGMAAHVASGIAKKGPAVAKAEAAPDTLPADFEKFDAPEKAPLEPFEQQAAEGEMPGQTKAAAAAGQHNVQRGNRQLKVPEKLEYTGNQKAAVDAAVTATHAGDVNTPNALRFDAQRPELEPDWLQGKDTDQVYKRPDGSWDIDREKVHHQILDQTGIGEKPQKANPRLIILGGGAASGKSGLLERAESILPDAVQIDVDHFKQGLPEYDLFKHSDPLGAAARVHEESSYLGKRALSESIARSHDIILDAVSSNPDKVAQTIDRAKAAGYRVEGHFIDADTGEALGRMTKRFERSGRWVPPDVMKAGHEGAARTFHANKDAFDAASLTHNGNEGAELIYERPDDKGSAKVYNQDRYEAHQRKGGDQHGRSELGGPGSDSVDREGGSQSPGGPSGSESQGPGVAAGGGISVQGEGRAGADHRSASTYQEVKGSGQIQRVPLRDIKTDPTRFQPRTALNMDRVRSIARNMAARGGFGDDEPIDLWKDPKDGKLYVMSGHHRLKAAELAKIDTATARVHTDKTLPEAQEFARRSNETAMALKPTEQAKAYKADLDTGKTSEQVGKLYGHKKGAQVEDQVNLLHLTPELQKHVDAGMLDVPRAIVLGKAVDRLGIPPELQQQVFDYIIKRREITPGQLAKVLDTFMPEAMKQVGFDFGKQAGFEGMQGLKGIESAMDEYVKKVGDLNRSRTRLKGFLKEADRMEREGTLSAATRKTRTEMQRAVKQLEADIKAMEDKAAKGEIFKTIGSEVAKGKELEGPQEAPAQKGDEEVQYSAAAPVEPPEAKAELFPGADQARAEVRGVEQGQQLTQKLVEPPASIEKAAGDMERTSPLYRGTAASPQDELFHVEQSEIKPPESTNPEVLHPANTLFSTGAILHPQTARALFPNAMDWLRELTRDKTSTGDLAKAIVRERTGEAARDKAQLFKELEAQSKAWDKRSTQDFTGFVDAIENGKAVPDPNDAPLAKTLRTLMDDRRDAIRALGTGKLENFIADYFPHIWKDPAKAIDKFKQMLTGRAPLQGPASFLKKRTIPTIVDGMIAGLKPESNNPVVMAMMKIHEMDRYLMAHKILADMKDAGLVRYVKIGGTVPDGWTRINDNLFRVLEPITYEDRHGYDQTALAIRGEYWAPKDAAKAINNHLSPGLQGNKYYDAFRGASNVLNQAQLGLSAFHLGFTTLDSSISDMAIAMQRATRGEIGKAILPAVRSVIPGASGLNTYLIGSKDIARYLDRGSSDKYAHAVELAGGRVQQDPIYKGENPRQFKEALKAGDYSLVAQKAFPALVEKMAAPIMDHIVPRMKLGVFHALADDVYSQAAKGNWSDERIRGEMQKRWDSVDNRMGQMVYDNLFWNRAVKDLGLVSVRSLGWNLGTLREIGGGVVKDLPREVGKAVSGSGRAELTSRMAYTMALPLITGIYGAMYQYAHTGQGPQELKDYFFPKTGKKLGNGNDERVSFPGYMKDIYAWQHNPAEVAGHKIHPLASGVVSFLKNEDFYGREIRHDGDSLFDQAKDTVKWALRQTMPFSFQGAYQRAHAAGEYGIAAPFKPKALRGTLESQIGITPSPGYIVRTPAEELAHKFAMEGMPQGPTSKHDAEQRDRRAEFTGRLRSGDIDHAGLSAAVRAGQLTAQDAQAVIKGTHSPSGLDKYFKRLTLPQAIEVWDKMSAAEQQKMRPQLAGKRRDLEKLLPEERKQMQQELGKRLSKSSGPAVAPPSGGA